MSGAATRLPLVLASLMGAAGVALAAAAAHGGDASRLGPASSMLLFHAPAILAAQALTLSGAIRSKIGWLAVAALLLGTLLFAGDLTLRHYSGQALFPMAAPIGGTLLIAGWVALAAAALVPNRGS